ncbi:hypothetical protein [uncultured Nostoc sp.]
MRSTSIASQDGAGIADSKLSLQITTTDLEFNPSGAWQWRKSAEMSI